MTIYAKKDIKRIILEIWPILSEYLGLSLGWDEFIEQCKKDIKDFVGFKLIKSKYPPCSYAGYKAEKINGENISYVYLAYYPQIKGDIRHHVCHELVHLFRGTMHRNRYKQVEIVSNFFEEALCDVIATRVTGKRGEELITKGLYNLVDVCALEQIIFNLADKDIRKFAWMPKTEIELKELTLAVLNWMSSKAYKDNFKKILALKMTEKVYY